MVTNLPAESTAPPKPPRAPFPFVTATLIALSVIGYVVELAFGVDLKGQDADKIAALGGNFVVKTLDGEWWRLVTSLFLTVGPLWLLVNVICLAQLRNAERIFSPLGHAAIWLLGGIVSGVVSCARLPINTVTVGGGGGVFALYGAYLAYLFVFKARFDAVTWQASLRSAGMFLAINLVFVLGASRVDPSPFFAGVATGAIAGVWLVRGAPAARARRAIVALAAGGAACAGALVALAT